MADSKEDEAFTEGAGEGFSRRNSSTRRSVHDQGVRALRYAGKTTVRYILTSLLDQLLL